MKKSKNPKYPPITKEEKSIFEEIVDSNWSGRVACVRAFSKALDRPVACMISVFRKPETGEFVMYPFAMLITQEMFDSGDLSIDGPEEE